MTFDDFHKQVKAKGDGLLPELEQMIQSPRPIEPTGQTVLELKLLSIAHAKASGPIPVGRVTQSNAHNVIPFPERSDSQADKSKAAL